MGKDKAAQIWTLQALQKFCSKKRRAVSAGELAEYMGISRNTAFKRLMELREDGKVFRTQLQRGAVLNSSFFPNLGQEN